MAVSAKISTTQESITEAPTRIVENNSLRLQQPGKVLLDIPPNEVEQLTRDGDDLLLQTVDGQTIRIENFYGHDLATPSQLYLTGEDDQQLILVELAPASDTGMVVAGYVPLGAYDVFEPVAAVAQASSADGAGIGALGWAIVGGGALAAGAIAADSGGGSSGHDSDPDQTAPDAPADLTVAEDGTAVTGTAEPGSTVTVTDADGNELGTATADPDDGSFSVPLDPALTDGEEVSATATDDAGNESDPTAATAPDLTAPDVPTIAEVTDDVEPITGELENGASTNDVTPALSGQAEAGSIVTIYANGNEIGSTTANSGGNWTFTPAELDDGDYIFTITATDSAGNVSDESGPFALTVDTLPPAAPVVNPTDGEILTGRAEPGSSVTLTDGQGDTIATVEADRNGNWSFAPDTPLDDESTVTAVARDAAGNTSEPGSATVDADLEDTLPPAEPVIITSIDATEPVTGNVDNGGTTNDPSPTLQGTAEATNMVQVWANDTMLGETQADNFGNWSFRINTRLLDGTTTFRATSTDPDGQVSNPSNAFALNVDTIPPDAPTIDTAADDVAPTGTLGDGDATNDDTPTLNGTAEPGSTVTLSANGTVIGSVTADDDGNWTFTPQALEEGDTTFTATATDAAGNISPPSAGFTLTLDETVPNAGDNSVLIDDSGDGLLNADEAGNVSLDGRIENSATITELTISDSSGNNITVDPADITVDVNGNVTVVGQDLSSLTDGELTATLSVTDAAGNTGSVTDVTVLDTTAPDAPALSLATDSGAAGDGITNDATVNVGGLEDGATWEYSTDGGTTWTAGTGTSFELPEDTYADGDVQVRQTDAAGNTSDAGSLGPVTVDFTDPAAPVIVSATDDVDPTGALADGDTTNDATPTLTGTAEANATVAILTNGTQIGTADADGDGNWTFTVNDADALPDGDVTFTATSTDAAGNVSPASDAFTLTVDTAAPAAPTVDPTNGDTITGTAEAGSTVMLTDGNGDPISDPVLVDGDGNWSVTPDIPLDDGTEINATAIDAAGNESAPATAIVDAVPPTQGDGLNAITINDGGDGLLSADEAGNVTLTGNIESSASITDLTIASSGGGTPVTVDPADITVDADGNVTVIAQDLRGLEDGELTATLSVTDAAGNTGTVTDTTTLDVAAPDAPTATLATDTGADDADGITSDATVNVGGLEDGATWEYSLDGGTTWTAGTGTSFELPEVTHADGDVQVRQTDAAGNTSDAGSLGPVTVDLTDPAAPTLALATDTGADTADGITNDATVNVSDLENGATWEYSIDGGNTWTTGTDSSFELPEGTYANGDVRVRQIDNAGNVGVSAGLDAVTIDATAPDAPTPSLATDTGLDGTDGITSDATVTVSGIESGATWEYSTDGGDSWASGSGNSFELAATTYSDGDIQVRQTDVAGNTSDVGNLGAITIDQTDPAAPTIDSATDNVAPQTGSLANGDATNDNTPELTGTAEAGSTITLYVDETALPDVIPADENGNWSFTTSALGDGDYIFTARATDTAGNVSPASPAFTLTVDTVAPDAPTLDATDGSPITGTAEAGATITLTDGNGDPIGTAVAGAQGNWSFSPETALADGTEINATATDAAGNVSTSANVTVDGDLNDVTPPAAPTIEFAVDDVAPQTGNLADGDSTNDTLPVLQGTAEAGSTVDISLNGALLDSVTADGQGNWSYTLMTELTAGDAVFTATATDANDNTSNTSDPFTLTVDTVTPDVPTIDSATDDVDPAGALADGDSTNDGTPTLNGTAEANAMVTILANGTAIGTTTADVDGNWTFTPDDMDALADGDVTFTATATDAAGNASGTSNDFALIIDTGTPTVPTPTLATDTGTNGDGITSDATVNVGGLEDGATWEYSTDGGTTWTAGTGTSFELPEDTYADGDVQVRQTDAAGNTSDAGSLGPVTVDLTDPAAPVIASATDDVAPTGTLADGDTTNDATPTLTGTAEANATVAILVNGTQIGTTDADGDGNWTFSVDDADALPDGDVAFTATSTDTAGNVSPASNTFTLTVDTAAPATPTIDPTNGDAITGTAEAGSTVTLTDADGNVIAEGIATDPDTGAWTYTADPALADGTEINATTTDAAGNESDPGTAIVDAVAPNADDNSIAINDGGDGLLSADEAGSVTLTGNIESGASVTGLTITSSNGGTPITVDPADITIDVDGNVTVAAQDLSGLVDGTLTATLSVTDAAGNIGTVTDTSTLDTTAPTVTDASASADEADLGVEVSGTIAIDDGGTGVDSVSVSGPDGITADGVDVVWSGSFSDGTYTLTGTADGTTVATLIVTTAGAYTFTQSRALDHSLAGADILALGFDVTATDGVGNASTGKLTVNLTDDVPIASQPAFFEIDTESTTASGSFVESYGADGGHVSQLTIDGYTFSYDPDNDSVSATGSSELVVPFAEEDYDSASGELTIRTVKGETLTVNMQTGDYDYDASGANLLDPEPEAAPVVALGDDDSLLGLVGVEALDLVNFSEEQAFAATDANNNISEVTISLSLGAATVNVGGGFGYSSLLAQELGLDVSTDDFPTIGLGGSASITVSTSDAEGISNQQLNELLGTIYINSGINLGIGQTLSITAKDTEENSTTTDSTDLLSLDLLQSNAPDYLVQGNSSADTLAGTADNDRLYGYAGDDELYGGEGSDLLRGGAGDDDLYGEDGNDLLIGGSGDDELTGGTGNDVFRWEDGDQGVAGDPVEDTITDFDDSRVSSGGDVLDLGSLLQGEGKIGKNAGNLTNYLHFALVGTATLVYISSTGGFEGITEASAKEAVADQVITLQDVDLVSNGGSDLQIIENLLSHGNLIVDDATADTDLSGSVSTGVDAVISDDDGDTAGTSVDFDSTGETPPTPDPDNVAPVVQADSSSLLGIAGADLLGLIDFNDQDFFAADADNNLQSVTVSYDPLLSFNLTALEFTASQQMANELGLSLAFDSDPGLLGLVAPSASVTITAADGGTMDNLAVNELLATVAFDDTSGLLGLGTNLQLSLLNATTITATDSDGRSASDSLGELADLDALTTLLGDNDNIIEGTSANETLDGGSDSQRLYGYEGNDTLNGGDGADLLRGGAGNDTLNGGAGNDLLIDGNGSDIFDAGAGDDLIVASGNGFASVDGGDGFDTLLLDGGIELDMVNGDLGPIANIERLDLGSGDNTSTATLSAEDVDAMTDDANVLQITGDEQDTLNIQGATADGVVTLSGTIYDQYTFGDTTLQVEQGTVAVET
ncbi:Ig-like domain-containing protein [Salinicola peritrichatus]|uniref:Ig-like domain-containing protein n=1 Tax=Salinicola peritrichatus TaxID=1267424 RepID=UPI0013A6519A|nr:Ig-like domain-containing protein [Salinicola peritrichatus]